MAKKRDIDIAIDNWVYGVSRLSGIPAEQIKESSRFQKFKKKFKDFQNNKIQYYEKGVEERKRKIEKYKKLIRKHEAAIIRLNALIEVEKKLSGDENNS